MSTVVAGRPSLYSHPSFTTVDKPTPATANITSPTKPSFSYKPRTCIIQSPSARRAPAVQRPKGKYAKVIALLPASTPHSLLRSKSFKDILKHLISPEVDASATDAEIMSFNGVTAQEFKAIAHIVQESPFFPMKLKLTHDPQLSVIIMEWPKAMHEIPLTDFRDELYSAVQQLPIDKRLLHPALETNFLIQSSQTGFSRIPDLSLTLLAMTSPVQV
ncbi:hypothetical protein EDD15DRAFT_2368789 [Pisolithus albus]|nr:hypothetical protein EDD15DRAFT_2368789 [Pisolithus albus]